MVETLPADMSFPDIPGRLHLLIFLLWDCLCLFISVESSAGSERYLNLPFMSVEQRLGTSMALRHLWQWLPRGEILPSVVCPDMSELSVLERTDRREVSQPDEPPGKKQTCVVMLLCSCSYVFMQWWWETSAYLHLTHCSFLSIICRPPSGPSQLDEHIYICTCWTVTPEVSVMVQCDFVYKCNCRWKM